MTLDTVLLSARRLGATDIHFEPFSDRVRIRFRIFGRLSVYAEISPEEYSVMFNILSAEANLGLSLSRVYDGSIKRTVDGEPLNIRLSVIPTMFGSKTELRLMMHDPDIYFAKSAASDKEEYAEISRLFNITRGLVLLTGPTGSGKTTTLYSFLKRLNSESRNIVTIEDPVEYLIDGINQTQTDEAKGYTFFEGLKTVLRQDPDIIMVGEIRDNETALTAVNAAISGRLVLSTLHTGDSVGVVSRLSNMGVAQYLVMEALAASVSQRLVNILCDNCKIRRGHFYEALGCDECGGTGIARRTAVYEVYIPTQADRDMIFSSSADSSTCTEMLRKSARNAGLVTIGEKVKRLLYDGKISLSEAVSVGGIEILGQSL